MGSWPERHEGALGFGCGAGRLTRALSSRYAHVDGLIDGYLGEFVRILRPGGVAMVTIPSHLDLSPQGLLRRVPNRIQNRWRRGRCGDGEVTELPTLGRARVEQLIVAAGGVVSAVVPDNPGRPVHTLMYVATKPAPASA